MTVFGIFRRRLEAFPEEEFIQHVEREYEAGRNLYADGFARAIWARQDKGGAIIQFEVASLDEAKEVIQRLPFMKAGMLECELIPVGPHRCFFPKSG